MSGLEQERTAADVGRSASVHTSAGVPPIVLSAARLGKVQPHAEGGWPEFRVVLTYLVKEDDIDRADEAAVAFFGRGDWQPVDNLPDERTVRRIKRRSFWYGFTHPFATRREGREAVEQIAREEGMPT